MPAATTDQPFLGRRRKMQRSRRDRRGGHLGQGGGAVGNIEIVRDKAPEIVAVERFRRLPIEIRRLQKPRDMRL